MLTCVRLNLREVRSLDQLRAKTLGFVFQLHHLIPNLPLWENVTLPALPLGLSRRERPHLAVDTNGIVRAITNGATPVWPCSEPNVCPDDYCFTSLELVGARD